MTVSNLMDKKPEKRFIGLNGNMWMYALGVMGINLAIGLVNSYQAEFFNKLMNVDLVAVAVIILVAKVISIVADFVFGNLIDRARFKSGKMRPWILMSAFPLAAFTMLSFVAIPFGTGTGATVGKYIYIIFVLVLWNVSMTMADIPSQGMLSFVTNNANDTNNAAGIANALKSAALACSGIFFTIVGMLTGSGGTLTQKEYLITTGILVGLGLLFQLLMYFKTKEINKSTTPTGMSFKEMFRELKDNKQILIVLGTYLLGFGRNIGLGIAVQATCILVRDGLDLSFLGMGTLYGDQCSWAIGITSAVASAITILLNPIINKKLGEKKYFIIAGFYGFAVSVVCFLCYVFGGAALRTLWAILVYQFFLGFSFGPNGYLPMVMTADIVDYQEWKTGKRTEGTQFAILSMSNKLSNALSVSMGLLLIGAIGYSSARYGAAVDAFKAGGPAISTYITDSMQNKAWAIEFLVPGVCMLLSSLLMFFYKIDEKTKKVMRAELAARRAAQNVDQAEATDNDYQDVAAESDTQDFAAESSTQAAANENIDQDIESENVVQAVADYDNAVQDGENASAPQADTTNNANKDVAADNGAKDVATDATPQDGINATQNIASDNITQE